MTDHDYPPAPGETGNAIFDQVSPARRYAHLLTTKDSLAPDRESAEELRKELPTLVVALRANREFVLRAVEFLAADCGIRQFLDVGCGMPLWPAVHEVAQDVDPAARIVYVDNDIQVMAHARALLTGTREGITAHAEADLRDPRALLAAPEVRKTLDFGRPIGVLLCAVLHFITDSALARAAVREIVSALPSGSYVVISHATYDPLPDDVRERLAVMAASGKHGPFRARSRDLVAAYLTGLELVEPGLVSTAEWRPDPDTPALTPPEAVSYAVVARKP